MDKQKDLLNPVCSEAVFRFHTIEPEKIQQILQAIKDEIVAHYQGEDEWLDPNTPIPLFATPMEFDTKWNGERSYYGSVRDKYNPEIDKIWGDRDAGRITQEEALERYSEIHGKMSKEIYPNSLLKACAGLGDNEAVVTIEQDKGAFRFNIGNNDIEDNRTGWIEKIKAMGISTEEAETCDDLRQYARDCTCGIRFFDK